MHASKQPPQGLPESLTLLRLFLILLATVWKDAESRTRNLRAPVQTNDIIATYPYDTMAHMQIPYSANHFETRAAAETATARTFEFRPRNGQGFDPCIYLALNNYEIGRYCSYDSIICNQAKCALYHIPAQLINTKRNCNLMAGLLTLLLFNPVSPFLQQGHKGGSEQVNKIV
jgi:hypothetical protein